MAELSKVIRAYCLSGVNSMNRKKHEEQKDGILEPVAPTPSVSEEDGDSSDSTDRELRQIVETGSITVDKCGHYIHCLTVIGQIEGHYVLPAQNKTTKYEHVIPQLVAIEESRDIEGLLIILNTVGGDIEAGLAIAELIAGMKTPTVSLVLGGGHSIGVPLAASSAYSFIAPSATMTVHPVRMTGLVLGVPQTMSYFEQMQQKRQADEEEHQTDIRLNILVDATPDATMKIIMDPIAGDYISAKGTGNIRTEFYNKGDVKMFGNYRISQGIYKFSLQEVIRKDFIIKDGSTITFNGAPLDANMDIQASYTVNSASLNDLNPDVSSIAQQTNVRVNCIMNLSGILLRPTIKLGIELPNERDEIQTLVRNYISTEEQMNMQILYLLGIGKFYTEDAARNNQNSNVMSSVLSSTLSGQLNNALSQVFETNNWNIGTNLSTGDKGWTDMEVEGILSGQLLNNRLLVNGNFGYRDNPMANTNFIGDFEAEWLINRSGDIRLKAYNETNDRYYTKTNLTTQGVGIMYKKDFNKWSDLFFWNKWKLRSKRKREEAEKVQQQQTDSIADDKAKSELKRKRAQE